MDSQKSGLKLSNRHHKSLKDIQPLTEVNSVRNRLQNQIGTGVRSQSAESSPSPNRLSKNHSVISNNLKQDDVQTTASRVGHKSSAVFGTAVR